MKSSQVTKEQLLIDISRLRDSHANYVEKDERRRREFAKAFNWYRPVMMLGRYHEVREPTLPSWEEIFVQVGKLLVLEELKNKVILDNLVSTNGDKKCYNG